jgi:hypothetical protein
VVICDVELALDEEARAPVEDERDEFFRDPVPPVSSPALLPRIDDDRDAVVRDPEPERPLPEDDLDLALPPDLLLVLREAAMGFTSFVGTGVAPPRARFGSAGKARADADEVRIPHDTGDRIATPSPYRSAAPTNCRAGLSLMDIIQILS